MTDVPFYDKEGIRITKGILQVPSGKQYQIRNINMVDIVKENPDRKTPIICIVIGFFLIAVYGIGLLLIGLGIWIWISQKHMYWLILDTNNSRVQSLSDPDLSKLKEVQSALNAAMER